MFTLLEMIFVYVPFKADCMFIANQWYPHSLGWKEHSDKYSGKLNKTPVILLSTANNELFLPALPDKKDFDILFEKKIKFRSCSFYTLRKPSTL